MIAELSVAFPGKLRVVGRSVSDCRQTRDFRGSTTAVSRLVFGIFAALAGFEDELSRERIMAGFKAARAPLPTATLCARGTRCRGQGVETSGGACRRISFPHANNPFKEGRHL